MNCLGVILSSRSTGKFWCRGHSIRFLKLGHFGCSFGQQAAVAPRVRTSTLPGGIRAESRSEAFSRLCCEFQSPADSLQSDTLQARTDLRQWLGRMILSAAGVEVGLDVVATKANGTPPRANPVKYKLSIISDLVDEARTDVFSSHTIASDSDLPLLSYHEAAAPRMSTARWPRERLGSLLRLCRILLASSCR